MNRHAILMMKVLTPTHAGSGTQISYVDLPIQRESHTGFPKIEASTLKGCIRSAIETGHGSDSDKEKINNLFGQRENPEFASAVSFSDARLLFFPVKSAIGIFAYITCPYVIQRFLEDCAVVKDNDIKKIEDQTKIESVQQWSSNLVFENKTSALVYSYDKDSKLTIDKENPKIILEDYIYESKDNIVFSKILDCFETCYLKIDSEFKRRALLVSDDDFCQFVKYSTEVATRIKINPETGTVDNSALFTEEFLPPESMLYSVVICSDYHTKKSKKDDEAVEKAKENKIDGQNQNEPNAMEDLKELFDMDIIQIGADSTLGKGLVKKTLKVVESHA